MGVTNDEKNVSYGVNLNGNSTIGYAAPSSPERDTASHDSRSGRCVSEHRFLGITILGENFPEARSISQGI